MNEIETLKKILILSEGYKDIKIFRKSLAIMIEDLESPKKEIDEIPDSTILKYLRQ